LEASSKPLGPYIAAVIRLQRIKREWSQERLALEAGMKPSEVSHLESGRRNPKVGTLERLANAIGVRISDILRLSEELRSRVDRL